MLENMLRDVATLELLPGVSLAQVGPAQRSSEVEFDLPMSSLRLDRLHAAMHRAGLPVPPLGGSASGRGAHAPLHGHLRGFVDTVFEHRGRWYLADWKSNHLGDTRAHYAQPALERVIAAQGYHLQHVLYAIALLRHLRRCLGRERADAAWGGAFVLFVRGMRTACVDAQGRPFGVFHRRLEPALLDTLAEGFGGANVRRGGRD
jgi:exodeoxyribonuclease V beta subunit